MQTERNLIVIPARIGSKGIIRKNLMIFDGLPLICHSIIYGLKHSGSRVFVSTDSEEIAQIALNYGAEVRALRPPELAADDSTDFGFMAHAADLYESHGLTFEFYTILRPTSPRRPPGLIEIGLDMMINEPSATSVRAVTQATEHPYRMWRPGPKFMTPLMTRLEEKEPFNLPRQTLPQVFFQSGDLEIVRRTTLKNGSVTGDNVLPLYIREEHVLDIDTAKDLRIT